MYFGEIPQIPQTQDKYYFICPYCQTELERTYLPYDKVHCAACNQSFHKKGREVMPDLFSLAGKKFDAIADTFCDRWTPNTAYIYEEFAVFGFKEKEALDKMCNYIDSHELMFEGLDFQTDEKAYILMRRTQPEAVAG